MIGYNNAQCLENVSRAVRMALMRIRVWPLQLYIKSGLQGYPQCKEELAHQFVHLVICVRFLVGGRA